MEDKVNLMSKFSSLLIILLGTVLTLLSIFVFLVIFEIILLQLPGITINATTIANKVLVSAGSIAILGLGAFFLFYGVKIAGIDFQVPKKNDKRQKDQYEISMANADRKAARRIMEERAIEKAQHSDISKALIGVQEIEALGSNEVFIKGFNVLAKELVRRKSWRIRISIVDALASLAIPIRKL